MPGLEIRDVSKIYGSFEALRSTDLHLKKGEMICFLGPSGCGKTTLLRLIAGLEAPSSGTVHYEGRNLTNVAPHRRNIGMVFQSFALFPHLSVAENIAYAMRIRGVPSAQCHSRVCELLDMIRLPGIEDRRISQLSGGQRQRVAIARALALSPDIFLLDEPMSALDANLREEMQIELRKLQQRLGVTTIVVTHDQTEAMTMADTVVVMGKSVVLQTGGPIEVYKQPVDRFVAGFIGTSNLLPASFAADAVAVAGRRIKFSRQNKNFRPGEEVLLMTRPEEIFVTPGTAKEPENAISGRVTFIRDIGATIEILMDCHGHEMISVLTPKDWPQVEIGMDVHVEMPAESCSILAV